MTLARRIIPTLLVSGTRLVKGRQFSSNRVVGDALSAARIHQGRQVDELVVLDVTATREGRTPDLALIEKIARECFMPLAVGGGIRTVEDVRQLLRHGADKVVVGTAAFRDPFFVKEAADAFGAQAIVVSMDIRSRELMARCGTELAVHDYVNGSLTGWAQVMEERGAGEILLQSIDRDGLMCGYDLPLIREVSKAVSIPVIASGGAGSYQDMLAAFEAGADACAVGAAFQFKDMTPRKAAEFLQKNGVEVRL